VIVPFYNSGETISQTIQSIELALAKSTPSEVQIIFVNNNSTDTSRCIVESYCSGRSYARMCCEPIQGVSNARNCGVSNATGEYIAFIDSDDTIDSDYFVELNHAISNGPDLIVTPLGVPPSMQEIEILSVNMALRRIKGWWCWQFVFRKAMAFELTFRGECYEDFGFFPILIERCNTVTIVNKPIYKYRRTTGSLTSRPPESRLAQLETLFIERHFINFDGRQEIECRLLIDYLSMKAQLRAMACILPVLPASDILRYIKKAPLDLMGTVPRLFYLSVSTAKRRFINFIKTLLS
jgi:glycosyltransferase involved in cell wall biosynthesis